MDAAPVPKSMLLTAMDSRLEQVATDATKELISEIRVTCWACSQMRANSSCFIGWSLGRASTQLGRYRSISRRGNS